MSPAAFAVAAAVTLNHALLCSAASAATSASSRPGTRSWHPTRMMRRSGRTSWWAPHSGCHWT